MSERAPGGQQPAEQQNDVTNKQENPASQTADNRAKSPSQATETITAVKSKIKEKPSSPVQDESLARTTKLSSTKLNKVSKRKRGKSKSNEALETQEPPVEVAKTEPAPPEPLQAESFYLESKMAINMSAVSKKSLVAPDAMSKSSRRLSPATEERKEDELQPRPSNIKKGLTEESVSTFVISHDVDAPRDETVQPVNVQQNEDSQSRRSTAQRHVHERGNYMSNISPAPIDDFTAQTQEEESNKEKQQQQQQQQ